jgi:hypothetical protein
MKPLRGWTNFLSGSQMKVLALLALLLVGRNAEACSPAFEAPAEFDPAAAYEGESLPTVPVARVVSIQRGRPAARGESTCVETSAVTIAVRDDSPRLPYLFEFREVAGSAPDLIFQQGIYAGGSNGNGERLFTFHWPEISQVKKPVDLQVEITPFTRSGLRGPSSILKVSDQERAPVQ